ncbi:MAG: stage 0 sporulation protein [Ruminococcaceae bacterium]|nr:stage 0 sporulation protein [Oscillospiraceae bacterium]
MVQIIGVRFRDVGKVYYFDPGDIEVSEGDFVIVETARGTEIGEVTIEKKAVSEQSVVAPLKKVVRKADAIDIKKLNERRQREDEAFRVCQEKIEAHKLPMNLRNVEAAFDGSKLIFYFIADGRVDFRELVKDLASIFRMRIELRQIGVRDEAKMLGGLGMCGRPYCCASFLSDFQPVSIKMAKEQNLSLNPTKISGMCGRLMCCLKYEQDTYEHLLKITPKVGAIVETKQGKGTVVENDILRGRLKVRIDNGEEATVKQFEISEVKLIKDGVIRVDKREAEQFKNLEG